MKQTAVEWLVNVVQSCIVPDYIPKEIVDQAKEMEKEQIMDAFKSGNHTEMRGGKVINTIAEQYYNETFKLE